MGATANVRGGRQHSPYVNVCISNVLGRGLYDVAVNFALS